MSYPVSCGKCKLLDARNSPCKCEKGLPTVIGIAGKTDKSAKSGRRIIHCEAGECEAGETEERDIDLMDIAGG
jgi:hypothetical protein